ncbi:MAG: M23 family metallopeptidase [Cellulomonas iranensis]|uniref:M23 family metallopeptidase n=1 Tax=Cellulomonas iranensis TaxID=76862 RepID=UPI001B156AD2|nr:M23 family metallopeptidase [Cellulomonas iranensis]MBO9569522.1 M23 family metallopeptidase [Cellulomonas iranensis]
MPAAAQPATPTGRRTARAVTGAVVATVGAYVALALATGAGGAPPPPAPPAAYRPPVEAPVVVRAFAPPPRPWLPGHRGVDVAAAAGAPVLAPADGVVTFAGRVVDRGVVTVLHPDGRRSSLEPVSATVAVGQAVLAGDALGVVAGSPHGTEGGPGVHWGVREGDVYVDPWDLLPGRGPVVLLEAPAG